MNRPAFVTHLPVCSLFYIMVLYHTATNIIFKESDIASLNNDFPGLAKCKSG